MKPPSILILCTGNSCRSQMAEGIFRHATGTLLDIHSAGTVPVGYVHPLAIEVLAQVGIDISGHTSKHYDHLKNREFDIVITVCNEAKKAASLLYEDAVHFHWPVGSPAKDIRGCETMLDAFRRVRAEIAPIFEAFAAGYLQSMRSQGQRVTFHPLDLQKTASAPRLETVQV